MTLTHGTCVTLDGVAVLLRGPSGSGKSDLALRLIDGGARLIADDQTLVTMRDGRLVASAPETIAGKMEVRGIGILAVEAETSGILGLVVDLVPDPPERMPEPETTEILGIALPLLRLNPFEASAAAKLRLAVRSMAGE
ncbi:MAG: HPr kinase/phosphatase C-terminal domain-containing protein [Alphaproteobacteria bacterium]|nr:HPr kinase/phosphatase C-terminal domain-containing protein [Alphaproteobacteria bacterium]